MKCDNYLGVIMTVNVFEPLQMWSSLPFNKGTTAVICCFVLFGGVGVITTAVVHQVSSHLGHFGHLTSLQRAGLIHFISSHESFIFSSETKSFLHLFDAYLHFRISNTVFGSRPEERAKSSYRNDCCFITTYN